MTDRFGLRRADVAPVAVTVGALFAWAVYAYLTVRVDSDILAEAMQVHSLLGDPRWVLSYPGQLYGGVLEYPLVMVADLVSPGNPYGFTLIRVLYLPIVGLLACVNLRRLSPDWSLWPVALVAAAGPAVMHGFIAIKDLYPFGWLVAMVGVTVLYRQFSTGGRTVSGGRIALLLVGGILVGLAVYQHPTTALFSLPLLAAAVVHWGVAWRTLLWSLVGVVIGTVPLVLALTAQPDVTVVYESTRPGAPQVLPAFGLPVASDSFTTAIVPNAWGVQFTDINRLALPSWLQWSANIVLLAVVIACFVAAIPVVLRYVRRRPVPSFAFIVVLWGTFLVVLTVLTAAVRPVFYYGAGVGILVWFTVGALPSLIRPRRARVAVITVIVAAMASTSLGAVLAVKPLFPHSITFKAQQVDQVRQYADAIEAAGIPFVYGTYWEALPIAYASNGAVHPLTSSTSRFPVATGTSDILVAVPDGTTVLPVGLDRWPGSAEAVAYAQGTCRALPDVAAMLPSGLLAFSCPADFVETATGTTAS